MGVMDTIYEFLPETFVVLGLLMVLGELVLGIQTGFDLLLIGSIMVISGFVGILTGSELLMLLLAIGLSVLYIAFGRKRIRQKITTVTKKTNIDKLLGATATVEREINPDTAGMVRVNDERWRASADEVLYAGDTVVIEGIEGVTVIVHKLQK
jgi:membrane protein implicated in regulation of membrane protease activity